MSESKFWCFTLNNPTDDEEQGVTDFLSSRDVTYGVFGRETGSSGTPHFQGFVILNRSRRLSFLRRKIARAHWSRRYANSTNEEARDYCRKDGDFEEFGTFPAGVTAGHRSDLDALIAWCDAFTEEHGRPPASPDIAKHQPHAYLKFPRFVALARHRAPRRQLEFGEPREWQLDLADKLSNPPEDDRTVEFYIDEDGEKGKTWFCRWMLTNNENCQVLGTGSFNDIANMIDDTKHIFLFNIGRGQMEKLCYPILEALKDKMVRSPKWHGRSLNWSENVHVIVFGNEEPDYTKLTAARYNVTRL